MTMRMLIDARHREETRVAVVKGSRIEEFDFESAERKQLKGNIYLAKVTRVEPSLQAAFVDYGGNRHGFLAFSEIHPDYYQIPREHREALLREEAEHAAEEERLRAAEYSRYDDRGDDEGADRKRLKQTMSAVSLPYSMDFFVRTTGLSRTTTVIKRDFDYLARLWDEIRERTLKSSAPALIYGDSDLIKRAIRDIYNRDIDEVIVEGDEGYRAARSFMKLLMPSHVRRVKQYIDTVPLFQRYGAEDQLAAMYQPVVQLKSGGYLVISRTEALVSIDINSGRSNSEHNSEQT